MRQHIRTRVLTCTRAMLHTILLACATAAALISGVAGNVPEYVNSTGYCMVDNDKRPLLYFLVGGVSNCKSDCDGLSECFAYDTNIQGQGQCALLGYGLNKSDTSMSAVLHNYIFYGGTSSCTPGNWCRTQAYALEHWAGNTDTATCFVKRPVCCLAIIATCLACQANTPLAEYCKENPETNGCIADREHPWGIETAGTCDATDAFVFVNKTLAVDGCANDIDCYGVATFNDTWSTCGQRASEPNAIDSTRTAMKGSVDTARCMPAGTEISSKTAHSAYGCSLHCAAEQSCTKFAVDRVAHTGPDIYNCRLFDATATSETCGTYNLTSTPDLKIRACDGSFRRQDWLNDGECDDEFNCKFFGCDRGDCDACAEGDLTLTFPEGLYEANYAFGYRHYDDCLMANNCTCNETGITPQTSEWDNSDTVDTCRTMCERINCTHFTFTCTTNTCTLHTKCTPTVVAWQDNPSEVFVFERYPAAFENGKTTNRCDRTHVEGAGTMSECFDAHAMLSDRNKELIQTAAFGFDHSSNTCHTLSNCQNPAKTGAPELQSFDGVTWPLPYLPRSDITCTGGIAAETDTQDACYDFAKANDHGYFTFGCTISCSTGCDSVCVCFAYLSSSCNEITPTNTDAADDMGGTEGPVSTYVLLHPPSDVNEMCVGAPTIYTHTFADEAEECINMCNTHTWCAHIVRRESFGGQLHATCMLFTEAQCSMVFNDATAKRFARTDSTAETTTTPEPTHVDTIETARCSANERFVSEPYTEHAGVCTDGNLGYYPPYYGLDVPIAAECKQDCDALPACMAYEVRKSDYEDTYSCRLTGYGLPTGGFEVNSRQHEKGGGDISNCTEESGCLSHTYAKENFVGTTGDCPTCPFEAYCYVKSNPPGTTAGTCTPCDSGFMLEESNHRKTECVRKISARAPAAARKRRPAPQTERESQLWIFFVVFGGLVGLQMAAFATLRK